MNLPVISLSNPTRFQRSDSWASSLSDAALALYTQIRREDSDLVQALEAFEGQQQASFADLYAQIMHQQPPHIQAFLYQTAVLDRFNAELCDAVIEGQTPNNKRHHDPGDADRRYAQRMLDELRRSNLFLIALDGEGDWYRYVPRFADFLKARLSEAERQTMHRKASAWFEAHGLLSEAIAHAFAANDLATTARLINASVATSPRFKLQLFGSLEFSLAGQVVDHLYSNKVQALLVYLALQPNQAHSRETLLDLLWGEYPEQHAQANLRNTLSKLKHILAMPTDQGLDEGAQSPVLSITRQSVQLTLSPAQDWIDVLAFDTLLKGCRTHQHAILTRCPKCIKDLSEAVALYRADFLAGWTVPDSPAFDEWRLLEHERLHRQMLVALDTLIDHHAELQQSDQVEYYARRQLALEPWHEQAHWRLMCALAAKGERTAALAQYESCRAILWAELAMEPDRAMDELASQLRATHPYDTRMTTSHAFSRP